MAKEPRSQREPRKAPQPVPEIPQLSRIRTPRKTNRKAAKLIESGVRLWDRRHVERVARRRALRLAEDQESNRLYERTINSYLRSLLKSAPGWRLMDRRGAIEPDPKMQLSFEELLESLLTAARLTELRNPEGWELNFRVAGLTYREHIELRAVLPAGITSHFIQHSRTSTQANARDFGLWSYDPRVSGPLRD